MRTEPWLKLRIPEIEKAFTQVTADLHRILILDGIDQLETGIRIRSHDLYGPMPEILVRDTGDRYPVLDSIERETTKLCAMIRMREDLTAIFPGCEFLLPMKIESGAVVGLSFDGRTVLAEDRTNWQAYHRLMEKAVRRIL